MQDELLKQILSEIKNIKSGQEILQDDVKELKNGQKILEHGQKALEQGQQRIEAKLDAAYEKIAENAEGITDIKHKFNQHAHLIGVVNKRVTSLENKEIGAEA